MSGASAEGLPAASLPESARFVVGALLPALVRGLFSPRESAMKLLTAVDADRRTVEILTELRRKHPGQGVRLLGGRIVTLWGPEAIREVLDRSAEVYASDGGAKGKGMGHFQPDALTVSRGEDWRDRRAFNESVLAAREPLHPDATRFAAVVAEEVARLRLDGVLTWDHMVGLFDHITLRVIFGDRARGDVELTEGLEKLMGQANRLVGLSPNDEYFEFYGRLERHLADPEPGSLLARFADAPQTTRTRVVHQIPHWIFATRDTLAMNVYRALAAIVADAAVCRRARREARDADLADPAAIGGLAYVHGCLQEAMRLWPTVPLIARETTAETTLAGERLDEGTQVMIVNTFNHRDTEAFPDADLMRPERWTDGDGDDVRFNHLSHGSQDCPGAPLVSLLGTAAIANLLQGYHLTLREPALSGGPQPHMLDFFRIRFDAEPAGV